MTNQLNNQTLKMTTAQVVETSVIVNNNSPIQGYVHPDDQTQPTFRFILLLFDVACIWKSKIQFFHYLTLFTVVLR